MRILSAFLLNPPKPCCICFHICSSSFQSCAHMQCLDVCLLQLISKKFLRPIGLPVHTKWAMFEFCAAVFAKNEKFWPAVIERWFKWRDPSGCYVKSWRYMSNFDILHQILTSCVKFWYQNLISKHDIWCRALSYNCSFYREGDNWCQKKDRCASSIHTCRAHYLSWP